MVIFIAPPTDLAQSLSISVEDAKLVVTEWRNQLRNYSATVNDRLEYLQVHAMPSDSLDIVLKNFSSSNGTLVILGYVIMVSYVLLALGTQIPLGSPSISLSRSGFAGLVLVAMANACAFGISGFCGISFNATSTQVLPFLALGLGVDDMFLMARTFQRLSASGSSREASVETIVSCLIIRKTGIRFTSLFYCHEHSCTMETSMYSITEIVH